MNAPRMVGFVLGGLVAVAALLAPLVLSGSQLTIYVLLGTAAMVTVGVSLLMGYAGQVSLGQAAFYAIGGYTAGLMGVHGLPTVAGLVCAPLVAGLLAALVGIPIMRLRGHYLAFATLAFQLILLSVVGQLEVLGGDIGLQGIPRLGIGSAQLSNTQSYAWLTWAATALVLLIARNVITSRAGRGLRALATSEIAAESSGVPVARYKLAVFALSAAFAGLAGGIYAFFLGYIAPGSFPVLLSFEFVVMAVVGGLGTIWGPVVGAAVITVLVQVLNSLGTEPGMPPYASSVFSYAVYALLLVLTLLFLPRGLLPTATEWVRRALRGREPPAAGDRPAAAVPTGDASGSPAR
ncbi:branched-chain amino acid ABC transporter permease [Pseudonocardia asaccharolytica]|uniref:Branched-chain amino acid ABC transporter permease n=1 Tax=Pseudonocardia asaccharolytica DSM 44247 = NBRC 16224 TaxID=1123024 RepID=A0A511CWF1_9PSEU|nr:branched-chain amino acid ABC transporter permease [Pseudonocardia asaccharolytica]GEL16882.1 branched-chain amino acid ABC transporter permease [Pseudonocardia asaccharolytica DSM 44247 = NBRC 16224]